MTDFPTALAAAFAVIAVLPFLGVLLTSFAKIAVVLGLLRNAIGTPQIPSNQIVTGLALVLTLVVMAPVGEAMWAEIRPWAEETPTIENPLDVVEIAVAAIQPLHRFLLRHGEAHERQELYRIALKLRAPEQRAALSPDDLVIAAPAFALTELREAFTIGFLLFLPFLVVDLVVANILLSLGMHGLSPAGVSLPFKLLLFVLADGWALVVHGLLLGYA